MITIRPHTAGEWQSFKALFFAVFLLVLVATLALTRTGGQRIGQSAESTPADRIDVLALLPHETEGAGFLGSVNINQIAREGGIEAILRCISATRESREDVEHILEEVKLDPRHDLYQAGFAVMMPDGQPRPDFLVVASGKFHADAFYERVSRRMQVSVPHAGYKLMGRAGPDAEEPAALFGILDNKVLVLGSSSLVKKAVEVYRGDGPPLAKSSAPIIHLRELQGSAIRIFIRNHAMPPDFYNSGPFDEQPFDAGKLKAVTLSGNFRAGVLNIITRFTLADSDSANLMQNGLQMLLRTAREPDVAREAKVTLTGNTVTLDMNVTFDRAERYVRSRVEIDQYLGEELCKNRLMCATAAIGIYNLDNRCLPPSLKMLVDESRLSTGDMICPVDMPGPGWHCSYGYIGDLTSRRLSGVDLSADTMILWDNAPRHSGRRWVVSLDMSMKLLTEKEFQDAAQELRRYLAALR